MSEKEEYLQSSETAFSTHDNSDRIDSSYHSNTVSNSRNSISFQIKIEYVKSLAGIVRILIIVINYQMNYHFCVKSFYYFQSFIFIDVLR